MKKMANYHHSWIQSIQFSILILVIISQNVSCRSHSSNETLTACQHIRRAESRRAKSLGDDGQSIRIPRCSRMGDFEPVQCSNDIGSTECWCVDEYGVEIVGSRKDNEEDVNCAAPSKCSATSCRMFCPAGFARDLSNGCPICKCRDPCGGVKCPRGLSCEPIEVKCKAEPCPPIPTCRKSRSFTELCPAGQPLAISDTIRPFLCGLEPGKPQCPPLYRCLVQSGNDYGVCCPASLKYEKPGSCPSTDKMEVMESAGVLCGSGCTHDLECTQMQKCCQTSGCGMNCQQPFNVTVCHQARLLSEILSVNEREGRGYVPQCEGPGGMFSTKQCSRNGLVCWCVDPTNGGKVKGTMGAASMVSCEGIENMITRGRSIEQVSHCDQNICAAICEYGFKHDHNGCSTCECSEPCEGFLCPMGSHCEVATDPKCTSGSGLCASEPVCKPNLVYSNPCDIGTPLADNVTGEVMFCNEEASTPSPVNQERSFYDDDTEEFQGRAMSNFITCPSDYKCMKLHKEPGNVCCPEPQESTMVEEKQQTMCEYLRDFSERMEGTEDGMSLAITSPKCDETGMYQAVQCTTNLRKVPRSAQKKYLEQQNVRQMRKLLETPPKPSRLRRSSESLKLYRIDNDGKNLDVEQILTYLRQTVSDSIGTEGRSAKVIDIEAIDSQDINEPAKPVNRRPNKRPAKVPVQNADDEMVEVEVEECWCVDGFGTEIPRSRGENVTLGSCKNLRQSLVCLDLTCRMGCDYGFFLSAETQCPTCECRDPCGDVSCPENQECRTVEVSCEGEYCPPVPACLPRKPGQCPFLVPPGTEGSDLNLCEYECRSDTHCEGNKRCCTNGCGTQCVEPQFKTACQHLKTIQLHQASELGVPPKQKYIAQCNKQDGSWETVQCGPGNECWCVDELGNEKVGTRIVGDQPDCDAAAKPECPLMKCRPCESGYRIDANGCRTCECKDACKDISCPGNEECELIQVECIDLPCPKMPICVPLRDSVCMEGLPLKNNGREISCGPQNDADSCPSTHSCQINPLSNRGVCCSKTRDVCFESMDANCMKSDEKSEVENVQKWRFSPRHNKCVAIKISKTTSAICQSKNLFHSETACGSVCPVLSQCERLKLKNSMAAKRAGGQPNAFFQPRCNSETGTWSPVQCLGNGSVSNETLGVCWCADKKGAPVKGSLTKGVEPKCNSRQARRKTDDERNESEDPVMEELIRQITYLTDENNFIEDENEEAMFNKNSGSLVTVTERILTMTKMAETSHEQPIRRSDQPFLKPAKLMASTTRCNALKSTASFAVGCDSNGSFLPTQCNENVCWCVDAAGNQLSSSTTFEKGSRACQHTPVEAVEIEMLLRNPNKHNLDHLYDVLHRELTELLGRSPDNFRVHENYDGNAVLKFDLIDDSKIDIAFTIEEMIRQNSLVFYNGFLQPDITRSGFMHRINTTLPVPQPASGIPESTFQTIVFILATASAFLVSIFVVFVMLKRGKNKIKNISYDSHKTIGTGDKYLDYSSPIFVLSTNEK